MSIFDQRKLRTGVEAAKEAAKTSSYNRVEYFKIEDGETAYVRFFMDPWEWRTVDMHAMVPTRPKPSEYTGQNWPSKVGPVCRNTKMGDGLALYGDCFVCENLRQPDGKPFRKQSRTWAVGVLREPVMGDGSEKMGGIAMFNKRIGFRDKTKEVADMKDGKPTGEVKKAKSFVLFTMGWKNFFNALEGCAQVYGTILDRDFAIKRTGENLETSYTVTGLDSTGDYDLRIPEVAAKYGIQIDLNRLDDEGNPFKVYPDDLNVDKMIEQRCSDEYYARFIDPTKPFPKTNEVSKPETSIDEAELLAMQARIQSIPVNLGAMNFDEE